MKIKIKDIFGVKPMCNKLYLITTPDSLIYVGMARSQSIQERLSLHISDIFKKGKSKSSLVSSVLFDRCPDYFEWDVEDFSISDIEKITGVEYDCLMCAEQGLYDYSVKKFIAPSLGNKIRPRRCKLIYRINGGITTSYQNNQLNLSFIGGKFEKTPFKTSNSCDYVFTNLNSCGVCHKEIQLDTYAYYIYGGLKRQSLICSKACMELAM